MQVRFFSLSCLLFLAYPVGAISRTSIWLLPVLLAFAAGYCRVIIRNTPQMHGNRAPLTVLLTLALGALMVPTLHYDWFSGLGVFAAIMLLINFPLRWWPVILTGLIGSFTLIAQFMLHAERGSIVVLLVLLVIVGATQVAVYKQIETSMQLQEARTELTHLAIAEERLRIARDLHDILGQRLSAVTLKAEIAAQMVVRDPHRAVNEILEVSATARDALAEVRAAVSGYRTVWLRAEAESSEALLTACGVTVTVAGPLSLPRLTNETAGWVVREATTNVIRHASAQRCWITVVDEGDTFVVQVADDGAGGALDQPFSYGTGLTGLAERIDIVGGELEVGPRDGRFVVTARIPANPQFADSTATRRSAFGRPR
ncbi:sensor histidine kinase [Micromonospora sp. WMMD987]|uniref:sensor histidine kinase n=1 Tax=Micromonospora TaxID=1873 RepID=UPI00249C91F7|nr:sensor histidine kinase [Micromonospora sp. WMMD987]WFE96113.1 sensor histidine kinase [Micromonospora sp. WMMD987]